MEISVSPTTVAELDCLRRYHTLRVLKKWPTSAGQFTGSSYANAWHEVAKRVYDPRFPPLPQTEHIDAWARSACHSREWPDGCCADDEAVRLASAMKTYAAWDIDASRTLGVEVPGRCRLAGLPVVLVAYLDRVIGYEDGSLAVRDYKTGRSAVTLETATVQLLVARTLFPGRPAYKLEIDRIGVDGNASRQTIEGSTLRGQVALLRERVRRYLDAASYPAEPGPMCHYCPLRPDCDGLAPVVDVAGEL